MPEMFFFKAAFAVIAAITLTVVLAVRSSNSRRRQARIDAGEQCMHCNSPETEKREQGVLCNLCGKSTSWLILNSVGPSKKELASLYSNHRD